MQSFGQLIRQVRLQNNLTLTQLAAKLKMDSANLSKIENGKRDFDEKRLAKLCKIFNLNYNDMKVELFSEKIAKKIYKEKVDKKVLLVTEKKIEYFLQKSQKQRELDL